MTSSHFWVFTVALVLNYVNANEEINATEILLNMISQGAMRLNAQTEAKWNFETNLTKENEIKLKNITMKNAKFWKESNKWIESVDWKNFNLNELRHHSKAMLKMGTFVLPEADRNVLATLSSEMQSHYANVTVCNYENQLNCGISLEPGLLKLFASSRDPEELKHYWREFQDKAGTPVRMHFEKYIQLSNEAAKLNNYTSAADAWMRKYEFENLLQQMEDIYTQLRPLYLQIHGYVRYRLRKFYGNEVISENQSIPIHLLGDLWGQIWPSIIDIVAPYPYKKNQLNITDELLRQGYTPRKMFEKGEEFFTSLNFSKLPDEFWKKSIFQKPIDGRQMLCHGSAWYFYRKNDVRIKQCTEVNNEHFNGLHRELGYIYHYLENQDVPYMHQFVTSLGFQEILGNVASLSSSSPKYLQRIGLLPDYTYDEEARINRLLLSALNNVVALPFILSVDKYRLALYRGEIDKTNWNCAFWKLRTEYSGIESPIERSEKDFDPSSLYHIIAGLDYMRYYVSFVLQFQFYKFACEKARQYEPNNPSLPLDNCDIYGSVEVGNAFKSMMSLGSKKRWPDLLEAFTGDRNINGAAMAEYYEPLRVWLETENIKNNVTLGWIGNNKCVK